MSSDSKKNTKYVLIIQSAKKLFWKYGIRRVNIEEICHEAEVSKMTFYRFFKNKTELAKTVLDLVMEDSVNKYRMIMKEDIPFGKKIKKTILFKLEGTKDISTEFLKDLSNMNEPDLQEQLEQHQQKAIKMILDDYTAAQKNGWIREDIKPEFILYYINKMYEFSSDESLLLHYNNAQDLIMELTNFFFYGILPREKTND